MLTAGLPCVATQPRVWDSQTLNDWNRGCSMWSSSVDDWSTIQQRLSTFIQHAECTNGMIYTSSDHHDTCRFRVDFLDKRKWSMTVQCYRAGPFHRTLPFIPNNACFLVLMCMPDDSTERVQQRLAIIHAISKNAGLDHVTQQTPFGFPRRSTPLPERARQHALWGESGNENRAR